MRALLVVILAVAITGPALARSLAQAPAPSAAPKTGPGSPAHLKMPPGPQGWPGYENQGFKDVTSKEAWDLIQKGAKFIDVRAPDEYAAAHTPGSINIVDLYKDPLTNRWTIPNLGFVKEVQAAVPDKNTPIVITCWGGGNSRVASNLLVAAGYKSVYNVYYGYDNHDLWPFYVEDPWGDFKSSSGAPVESKLNNVVASSITVALSKVLGVFPDGLPTNVTTFILGDEYLVFAAQLFGINFTYGAQDVDDYLEFFKNNADAAGKLRHSLVYGIVPSVLTPEDLKSIGLTGVESALPGAGPLKFNHSGTTVVTPVYAHSNIYGHTNGNKASYVIDYPLLPVPAKDLKPITAAEAQKVVNDALAKAGKAPTPAKSGAGR